MVDEGAAVLVGCAADLAGVVVDIEARKVCQALTGEALVIFQCADDGIGRAGADMALVLDWRTQAAQVDAFRKAAIVGLEHGRGAWRLLDQAAIRAVL